MKIEKSYLNLNATSLSKKQMEYSHQVSCRILSLSKQAHFHDDNIFKNTIPFLLQLYAMMHEIVSQVILVFQEYPSRNSFHHLSIYSIFPFLLSKQYLTFYHFLQYKFIYFRKIVEYYL